MHNLFENQVYIDIVYYTISDWLFEYGMYATITDFTERKSYSSEWAGMDVYMTLITTSSVIVTLA